MKVKNLVILLVLIIVAVVVFSQITRESDELEEHYHTPDRTKQITLLLVNATSSTSSFTFDGITYKIDPDSREVLKNVGTGTHYYHCSYEDHQFQHTAEKGEIHIFSDMTITISPRLGVFW